MSLAVAFLTLLTAQVPFQLGQAESWADTEAASASVALALNQLQPKDSRYKARAGALHLWAGDAETAARYFDIAIALDPDDEDTYLEVLQAYVRAGGYETEVEEWAEKVESIAIREKEDGTLVSLAWYRTRTGDREEAYRLFELAIRTDPKDLDNHIEHAAAMLHFGDEDAAFAKLARTLSSKPKEERLYWKAGEVINGFFDSYYGRELN